MTALSLFFVAVSVLLLSNQLAAHSIQKRETSIEGDFMCYQSKKACEAECGAATQQCYAFDKCNGQQAPSGQSYYVCSANVGIIIGIVLVSLLLMLLCCGGVFLICCCCPACLLAKCLANR